MERIMFDSNAFSYLLESGENLSEFLSKCNEQYEFFITAVQVEELAKISDDNKEVRIRNLLCLCKMRAKMVETVAVFDYGRFDFSRFGNGEDKTYENLLNETRTNVFDAMIGEAAKHEGCILVTDDVRFRKKLIKNCIPTMTFEEFRNSVDKKAKFGTNI